MHYFKNEMGNIRNINFSISRVIFQLLLFCWKIICHITGSKKLEFKIKDDYITSTYGALINICRHILIKFERKMNTQFKKVLNVEFGTFRNVYFPISTFKNRILYVGVDYFRKHLNSSIFYVNMIFRSPLNHFR